MNDEKVYEILMEIKTDVASVKTQVQNFQTTLTNHENRLMKLEEKKTGLCKDKIVEFLVKGLLIALGIIGTLTGSATLIKPILANQNSQALQTGVEK